MTRTPRRYSIHLLLSSGQEQVVAFPNLDEFQKWYGEVLIPAPADNFVNVPIRDLDGEYLVLRAGCVIGLRVEPVFSLADRHNS